ncbi:MAG: hypothetical protein GY870_11660 [archaeon]|nr:hypothetical protein [archaeon]
MKKIHYKIRIAVIFAVTSIILVTIIPIFSEGNNFQEEEYLSNRDSNLSSSQGFGIEPQFVPPPSNTSYVLGSTDNYINWTVLGIFPGNTTYRIYKNSEVVKENIEWDQNSSIILDIDGLELGPYNFTIVIEDNLDTSISSVVLIRVINNNNGIYILMGIIGVLILVGVITIKKR